MTIARRAVAGLLAGAAVAVAPLTAGSATDLAKPDLGDYVSVSTSGGVVQVGTGIPGQPLFGASVNTNTGEACVGFSYQVPQCASIGISFDTDRSAAIPSPVWVDADNSDGSVGAGVRIGTGSVVGVRYYSNTGDVCVGVGHQRPFCARVA